MNHYGVIDIFEFKRNIFASNTLVTSPVTHTENRSSKVDHHRRPFISLDLLIFFIKCLVVLIGTGVSYCFLSGEQTLIIGVGLVMLVIRPFFGGIVLGGAANYMFGHFWWGWAIFLFFAGVAIFCFMTDVFGD